ncbi:MAG: BlaI/MecI/CopY family transcriptional regulator [Spirosomataceae bacterium]
MENQTGFCKDLLPFFTDPPLHYNTVSTIIRTLEEKGYVGHQTYGNTHEYFPIISKEAYQNEFVINKLVGDYFDHSFKNMVSYFAQNEKVTAEELREILRMIEEK